MQVGTGKSILNGIAIGKVKIYKKKDTAISTKPVTDTGAELLRFEDAQQKAIAQQTALYEKALDEAGEEIAEVFNIHAMMLEDDDFVDAIKEIITKQKMCAEYAVKTAGTNQAAVFAAMGGRLCRHGRPVSAGPQRRRHGHRPGHAGHPAGHRRGQHAGHRPLHPGGRGPGPL